MHRAVACGNEPAGEALSMVEGSEETPAPVERVSGHTPSGRLAPAPAVRGRHHHRLLGAVVFTVLLLGLMALAVEAVAGQLAFVLLGSVVALIAASHRLFPGAEFFTVALANFIGLY